LIERFILRCIVLRRLLFFIAALVFCAARGWAQSALLPKPPQVRAKHHVASLALSALNKDGRDAFAFNGATVPPIIRVSPGDVLKINYFNNLPIHSPETCAIEPCMDMTNLHFHGMAVSPDAPQDDVLTMLAKPGEVLHYSVPIPRDHLPGLFWYHTHPHGESNRQVADGMSGAIIVEGMERYVPELRRLRERVLIVRGHSITHDPNAAELKQQVEIPAHRCWTGSESVEEIFTVNGVVRPNIEIAPGERQFWRVVNAASDRYLDLQVDGQPLEIVALDGAPIAYHEPDHPKRTVNHVLVAPAGRVEAIVTGPPPDAHATLRTLCVDTGPAGDDNPGMVLADLLTPSSERQYLNGREAPHAVHMDPPAYKQVGVERLKKTPPDFTVTFTEDKNGFYINGQKFAMDAPPMTVARVGTYQHWRIVNATSELHPFHIHQAHFLAYAENDRALPNPAWLDTVNVPYDGTVDVILDFTDPIIKGMSVFHCHLLNHEDKGMMAKILFK
jgi:FtsP/CotA-like multicopper oxidase with cupredoxin domain